MSHASSHQSLEEIRTSFAHSLLGKRSWKPPLFWLLYAFSRKVFKPNVADQPGGAVGREPERPAAIDFDSNRKSKLGRIDFHYSLVVDPGFDLPAPANSQSDVTVTCPDTTLTISGGVRVNTTSVGVNVNATWIDGRNWNSLINNFSGLNLTARPFAVCAGT